MKRDPKLDEKPHAAGNCNKDVAPEGAKLSREISPWSRRKFLANSTGFALAGAIGGLASQLPAATISVTANSAQPASSRAIAPAKPRRIILDTDPGIDDMMAIFLALRSPELQVEAITPVCGNVPLEFTLPNALRLVEIAGRPDVPVAAGASHPLVRRLVTSG
ncbi:MAG: nucleoside hydrolase, partial [Candidatus Acidiferrales bacterium]